MPRSLALLASTALARATLPRAISVRAVARAVTASSADLGRLNVLHLSAEDALVGVRIGTCTATWTCGRPPS